MDVIHVNVKIVVTGCAMSMIRADSTLTCSRNRQAKERSSFYTKPKAK